MINETAPERIGDFSKNVGEKDLFHPKKLAQTVLENPGKALENGANAVSTFISLNLKAVLSIWPELITFYHTGKGVYFNKFMFSEFHFSGLIN